MDPVLLPVWPDTAAALGVGRTTVYELIASGALTSVRVGRRRLVPAQSVHAYVDALIAEQTGSAA